MAETDSKLSLCDLSDEELVKEAQFNNSQALELIISRYRNFVYSKVKTYFLVGADRDDIVQEGMIGLYKAICDFNMFKNSSFKTFASVCVSRQIITAIKTANRQKHIPLNSYISLNKQTFDDNGDGALIDVIVDKYPQDPESIVIDKESLDGIENKISQTLSKLELQVLVYYLEGRTYQEISELINKDIKSVDNAIQRIKKKLEAILKKD